MRKTNSVLTHEKRRRKLLSDVTCTQATCRVEIGMHTLGVQPKAVKQVDECRMVT